MKNFVDIVTIIIALAPIGVKIFNLLTVKTQNQRIKNLSERANIIVAALEQADITNDEKKHAAMVKLEYYSKEVGINVTAFQLEEYIEASVNFLKAVNNN